MDNFNILLLIFCEHFVRLVNLLTDTLIYCSDFFFRQTPVDYRKRNAPPRTNPVRRRQAGAVLPSMLRADVQPTTDGRPVHRWRKRDSNAARRRKRSGIQTAKRPTDPVTNSRLAAGPLYRLRLPAEH